LYVTLVIYQESLHDARSTKYKILQVLASESKRPSFQSVDGNPHASHGF